MTVDAPYSSRETADASWQQIEQLVDDIALLAKSETSAEEFHVALLDRSIAALAAPGGAVWIAENGSVRLQYEVGLGETPLTDEAGGGNGHARLLQAVLSSGVPRIVAPQSGAAEETEPANPSEYLLLLCPLRDDGATVGVVEIAQRSSTAPAAQQGAVRLLASFCELATEFYSLQQLRTLRSRESLRDRFEAFSSAVHQSLEFNETVYTIANDGRALLESDRLSVAARRRGRFRLASVSGAHRLERRSNSVRLLEKLTTAVLAAGRPLCYSGGETDDLPPEIKRPLAAYLDESPARLLAIHPLRDPSLLETSLDRATIGALIVEQFDAAGVDDLPARIEMLSRHSEPALRNASEFHRWPLSRVFRNAGWFVRAEQLPRTVLVLAALVAAALALLLIPADFEIEAKGRLQPQRRRDVFAPRNGSVEQLLIREEKDVGANEPLVVLRDADLDIEFNRVWGEMQTARKRLASIQARRGAAEFGDAASRAEAKQLSAEEAEIKEQLRGLHAQYEILQQQQDELTVRSPIAGRVLTWNVEELLESRPVQTGQILLTVADPEGPWELELRVPDDEVGHLLDARQSQDEPLEVSFILATNPNVTYEERLDRIAMSTELDAEKQPTVLAVAGLANSPIERKRPGATVIARIHCGRRPLGYVWLRELIEAVQRHILF